MEFITLVKEASSGENVAEAMNNWAEILDYYICKMKDLDENLYDDLMNELYIEIYGEKVSKEAASKWVKSMKPVGEHWTIDETKKALPNYDEIDGYIVANMIYNDYYDILKNNDALVIKMVCDWLDDEDADENKVYNYWKYIIKKD